MVGLKKIGRVTDTLSQADEKHFKGLRLLDNYRVESGTEDCTFEHLTAIIS